MTKKTLTVDTPNGQIEVEEGDRFYAKRCTNPAIKEDEVYTYKPKDDETKCYNWFIGSGASEYVIHTASIDFTRPAPDEDGWIKYYGTGQPVDDDVIVQLNIKKLGGSLSVSAKSFRWNNDIPELFITHYRIVEEIEDNTNPPHYRQGSIEPIDYIEANDLGFREANIIKYVTRYKHKNGVEDLKKAKWYIERLINAKD